MNPSEYCEFKESNLHYILNDNAFSIQINIKNKIIDEKPAARNKLKVKVKIGNQIEIQGKWCCLPCCSRILPTAEH